MSGLVTSTGGTDGRVVLITGTRKGIGRYLAEHYVAQGFAVEGCSRGALDWQAPGYRHHRVDVTDEAQVKAMMHAIQVHHGRLDVLINNAGRAGMNHMLLTPVSMVEEIMSTNVMGTFLLSREAAKIMRRRRFGRIVNLSSVAVCLALEGEAIYAASKGAVETLTRVLAHELAPLGITCNAVAPTPIDTDLIRRVPQEKIDRIVQRLAIKRLGRCEDVANVIDFIIRPESGYVTGQVIGLGGV